MKTLQSREDRFASPAMTFPLAAQAPPTRHCEGEARGKLFKSHLLFRNHHDINFLST